MANTTIKVQDSTGVALSEATVSYLVNAVKIEGTTDTNGELVIAGLEAGTYTFTATLSGYTSASVEVAVTEDTNATGEITLTETEEESTVSTITDAAKTAAIAAAEAALTSELTSAVSTATSSATTGLTASVAKLIQKGTDEITRLSKEIGTTHDFYVKYLRNPAEIVLLTGLIAGAGAGVTAAIKELTSKLE